MSTLHDARTLLDKRLTCGGGHVLQDQCEAVLCEDMTTVMFFVPISNGDMLAISIDPPPSKVQRFDSDYWIRQLLWSRCCGDHASLAAPNAPLGAATPSHGKDWKNETP